MIEQYSSSWPIKYNKEYHILKSELGNLVTNIQHIGSTAIPEMRAKPIIDIMVAVKSLDDAGPLHPILEKLSYKYEPDMSSTERLFFRKGDPVEFHLSVAQPDHTSYWERQILFRDYLREHPEAREEYELIKKEGLRVDPTCSTEYIANKSEFVGRILRLASFRDSA
jgi:GrpB-like predicted nucleotidyltransferase (UPF0157 family)